MKALSLTLACAFSFSPLLSSPAAAQQRDDERYTERKRFPVVRNVFRQIRSDVRYHAGALRDTASGIGHGVKSTIRGEREPGDASQNQYGYRSVPQAPQPALPPRRDKDYYEEPALPRYPTTPPETSYPRFEGGTPAQPRADQNVLPRRDPNRSAPSTVNPAPQRQDDPLTEIPELERLPDTDDPQPEADAAPSSPDPSNSVKKSRTTSDKQPKTKSKPIVGKRVYPEAKRSNRPGFHYSPYAPYELLDTQGIAPGGLAKDPGNGNIFRLPK